MFAVRNDRTKAASPLQETPAMFRLFPSQRGPDQFGINTFWFAHDSPVPREARGCAFSVFGNSRPRYRGALLVRPKAESRSTFGRRIQHIMNRQVVTLARDNQIVMRINHSKAALVVDGVRAPSRLARYQSGLTNGAPSAVVTFLGGRWERSQHMARPPRAWLQALHSAGAVWTSAPSITSPF